MDADTLKTLLDIGLGGVSLLLWLRQGKVNKLQLELDTKQNKATEDLTTMVRDHEERLKTLEHKSLERKAVTRRRIKVKKEPRE